MVTPSTSPKIRYDLKLVTPEMSQEFLARSSNNPRRLSQRHMEVIASDFERDEFHWIGTTLLFDREGHLVDGAHRCTAAVQTGRSFWAFLVYDIDNAAIAIVDNNQRSRRLAHVLAKQRGLNPSMGRLVESCARQARAYCFNGSTALIKRGMRVGQRPQSVMELQHFVDDNPNIFEHVAKIREMPQKIVPQATLAVIYYLTSEFVNEEKAAKFAEGVDSGANLIKGSPILKLRERLASPRSAEKGHRLEELPYEVRTALTLKAWKLFNRGVLGKRLIYQPTKEGFPEIDGMPSKEEVAEMFNVDLGEGDQE
jgi:hypothetical protein